MIAEKVFFLNSLESDDKWSRFCTEVKAELFTLSRFSTFVESQSS